MAFDKTKPANTTKLRNVGEVIRPNGNAIDTADATFKPHAINLIDRTAEGLAVDPTDISDATILYSKQDGAGDAQAYSIAHQQRFPIYQLLKHGLGLMGAVQFLLKIALM